ncbi:MAG: helix-turn-helix transcriptional regulator [Acetobacteraceae bacterium]|nr:helix-turn-helix transcriptional regulator [Acetobacteraceae bacterium]
METIADRRRRELEERIAEDIQRMRTLAEVSQAGVAASVGRQRNWVSEIERGKDRIALSDFLMIMDFMRAVDPGHRAVALYDCYIKDRSGHGPG